MSRSTAAVACVTLFVATLLGGCSTIEKAAREQDGTPGVVMGASVGVSQNSQLVDDNTKDGSVSGINEKNTGTAYSVWVGYKFNPYIGVQANYSDNGTARFDGQSSGGYSWSEGRIGTKGESSSYGLTAVGMLPVSPRVSLFAEVGVARTHKKDTFYEPYGESYDVQDSTKASYGLGMDIDVGKPGKCVLRGKVSQQPVGTESQKVNQISLGAYYKF